MKTDGTLQFLVVAVLRCMAYRLPPFHFLGVDKMFPGCGLGPAVRCAMWGRSFETFGLFQVLFAEQCFMTLALVCRLIRDCETLYDLVKTVCTLPARQTCWFAELAVLLHRSFLHFNQ